MGDTYSNKIFGFHDGDYEKPENYMDMKRILV